MYLYICMCVSLSIYPSIYLLRDLSILRISCSDMKESWHLPKVAHAQDRIRVFSVCA